MSTRDTYALTKVLSSAMAGTSSRSCSSCASVSMLDALVLEKRIPWLSKRWYRPTRPTGGGGDSYEVAAMEWERRMGLHGMSAFTELSRLKTLFTKLAGSSLVAMISIAVSKSGQISPFFRLVSTVPRRSNGTSTKLLPSRFSCLKTKNEGGKGKQLFVHSRSGVLRAVAKIGSEFLLQELKKSRGERAIRGNSISKLVTNFHRLIKFRATPKDGFRRRQRTI